jgi:hypothetical protein
MPKAKKRSPGLSKELKAKKKFMDKSGNTEFMKKFRKSGKKAKKK